MHEFKDYIQFLTFLTAKGKSEMDINFPDLGRAEVSQLGAKNKNSQLVYTLLLIHSIILNHMQFILMII